MYNDRMHVTIVTYMYFVGSRDTLVSTTQRRHVCTCTCMTMSSRSKLYTRTACKNNTTHAPLRHQYVINSAFTCKEDNVQAKEMVIISVPVGR